MASATISKVSHCPNCGRAVVPGWHFCETCSAPLDDDLAAAMAAPATQRRLSSSPLVWIALVAAILAIVIIGSVVMTQRTQHRLDQTKTTLKSTQQQLTTTQGQLATTTKARDDLKAQL